MVDSLPKYDHPTKEKQILLNLEEKQAEEKRLLGLLIQSIQQTGECNYPALVHLAHDIFSVENANGESFTQEQLQQLLARIKNSMEIISETVAVINYNLKQLNQCINAPEKADISEYQISRNLQKALRELRSNAIELVTQAHKYLPLSKTIKDGQSELAHQQYELQREIRDIYYICNYLDEHLQVEIIKQDYVASGRQPHYFRRINSYKELLVTQANALGKQVLLELENKRTGGKFASAAALS
jgi:hypothetical protein